MLQLKLSYGTEKISCLMSRHYLEDKTDNANLPQWYSFIKRLYDSILTGEYQSGEIEFKVPLSKVQLFKLKKVIAEEENIFTENIEGKCLDINL